jgi:hypothetical protein
MKACQLSVAASLVFLAACSPRLISAEGEDDGTTSTSSSSATTEPTSTSTTADPTDDPPDDTTSTNAEATFLPPVDTIVETDCDPFAQDCPEGEKCVPYASNGGWWDDNKCVPVLGAQPAGEPCTYAGRVEATDDCDATSMCWNVDDEGIGTCHAFCMGTADNPSCPDGFTCPITSDGTINVCIAICDPLLQDCDEGLGCYWANVDFNCISTTQDLPPGAPCGYVNDCAPGNICLDATVLPDCLGSACCSTFCDVNLGPGQCDVLPGTTCVPFWEQGLAPDGYEHIGVCIVP